MKEKKFIVQATIPVEIEVYAKDEDTAEDAAYETLSGYFDNPDEEVSTYGPIINDVAEIGECLPGDISDRDFF